MKYLIYILVIVMLIGITFGIFSTWGWNGLVPDFLLLITISLALAFEKTDYIFFGFVGGAWFDILYGLPLGSFTIPVLLSSIIIVFVFRQWLISEVKWYHFIVAVILSTLALHAWIWGYTYVLHLFGWWSFSVSGVQIFQNIWFGALSNVVLAYPIYAIVELLAKNQSNWQKNKIRL